MIAVDSSVLISYMQGENGKDIDFLRKALIDESICISPVVISEVFSHPYLRHHQGIEVLSMKTLDILDGYWERAGLMRAKLIGKKFKPKLPDTLIAQSCIDHNVPLLTRDEDFSMFQEHCGLQLI